MVASLAGHIAHWVPLDMRVIRAGQQPQPLPRPAFVERCRRRCLRTLNPLLSPLIALTSAAARLRATMAEPLFLELGRLRRDLDNGIGRLESTTDPDMSIFQGFREHRSIMLVIPAVAELGEGARVQTRFYAALCSGSVRRRHLDEVLWARAEYWIEKLHIPRLPSRPPDACRLIALLAKWLPAGSVFASVRAISNAWQTFWRVARLAGSCPFCRRGPGGLLHFLASCSAVRDASSCVFLWIRGPVDPLDLLLVPLMLPTTASQRTRFFP